MGHSIRHSFAGARKSYIEDLIKDQCELNHLPKPDLYWEAEDKNWRLRVKFLDLYVVKTFSYDDLKDFPDAENLDARRKIRDQVASMIKQFNPTGS